MKNSDESAFPIVAEHGNYIFGLTKREYFAAMAMQGICANNVNYHADPAKASIDAIRLADELLKELEL